MSAQVQLHAAEGVVERLLGSEAAAHFEVEIIPQEEGLDVFEVESVGDRIVLRGSNGLSACRGLKWYLETQCHCSFSWRGDNLQLPATWPEVPETHREAMGNFATHYCARVKDAYEARDIGRLREASSDMLRYVEDFDRLMSTSEHFLLGKWIADARSWGASETESDLMEWAAKQQITDWGGHIGGYAVKEWAGIISSRSLPLWKAYLEALETHLETGDEAALARYRQFEGEHIRQWPHAHGDLPATAQGDPIAVSKEMWARYGEVMLAAGGEGYVPPGKPTPKGLAVGKPIEATDVHGDKLAEFAVDGEILDRDTSWWAIGPASLTIDLEAEQRVLAFQVYPYWDGQRYYQYTIDISTDGREWRQAVDKSRNEQRATPSGHLHNFQVTMPTGFTCRYVRLNMLKNSANPGVHVVEFKVFGLDAELQ